MLHLPGRSALAAIFALLAVPIASAGDAQSPLTIESMGPLPASIPYGGNATANVTLGVGCVAAVEAAAAGQGAATATVQVQGAPDWLAVAPVDVTFDATGCSSPQARGYILRNGTVELRAAPDAPGVVLQSADFTATMPGLEGNQSAAPYTYAFNVTYRANHTLVPDLQFPATMTGQTLEFNVTVNVTANAPTMVMIESLRATAGSAAGLQSALYDPPEAKVFRVSFKAPDTPWNETVITFRAYSHYLVNATGLAGHPQMEQEYVWVVRNGGPRDATSPPTDAKASPAGPATLLALAGAAGLAARRRRPA